MDHHLYVLFLLLNEVREGRGFPSFWNNHKRKRLAVRVRPDANEIRCSTGGGRGADQDQDQGLKGFRPCLLPLPCPVCSFCLVCLVSLSRACSCGCQGGMLQISVMGKRKIQHTPSPGCIRKDRQWAARDKAL
jgi:hypothetical protein